MGGSLKEFLLAVAEVESRLADSGGEVDDEQFELLVQRETALQNKVDRFGTYLERLALAAEHYKGRAQHLQKMAKGVLAHKERLKRYIKEAMLEEGKGDLQGDEVRFTLRKSKAALVLDEKALPKDFFMEVRELVPDKERIRQALEAGEDVSGAHLREGYALSQKVKKYE